MLKAGRYTAALLLIAVGAGVLIDKTTGSDLLTEMVRYWPVLLIMLGVEYLIMNFWTRGGERKIRFDFGGLVLSLIVSAVVVGLVMGKSLFGPVSVNFTPFQGKPYEKAVETFEVSEGTTRLLVENPVGDVSIVAADVAQIAVKTTVYVHGSEKKAASIVEESGVEVTTGSTMKIRAEGKSYSSFLVFNQKTRMDLQITVPKQLEWEYELDLTNGDAVIDGLTTSSLVKVKTLNGDVRLSRVTGDVELKTTNGDLATDGVNGDLRAQTLNGDIRIKELDGDIKLKTTNGDVVATGLSGSVEAETLNGEVEVKGALQSVSLKTLNGDIVVHSETVEGDWNVKANMGDVVVYIPEQGDFKVDAKTSLGDIITDLPLRVEKKRVEGSIGGGTHSLVIQTRSDLIIKKQK